MLLELSIENYALVRSLRMEFRAGLSAITGESGAGKSLLLGALGQVLGDRADIARISPERTSSQINALFDLCNAPSALQFLKTHGLENPDAPNECLLHRRIDISGRSRAYVNNLSVTLGNLRPLASQLVDIHAQDQHHALRTRRVQQQIFDEFAATPEEISEVVARWRGWQAAKAEADSLRRSIESHRNRVDLLTYQVEELDQLSLQEGEYTEIVERHNRLSGIDALRTQAGQAIDLLDHEEFGITSKLSQLSGLLEQMKDGHRSLQTVRDATALAMSELSDAVSGLRHYAETLHADPQELELLDQRLSTIVELSRKHRINPEDLQAHHITLRAELDGVEREDARLSEVEKQVCQAEQRYRQAAELLSKKRRAAQHRFEAALSDYMARLGLEGARIEVVLSEHMHELGFETLAFHYAASQSLQAVPIEKVASGGERSRLALAVALLAAQHTRLPTLVLDEADVGIGGRLSDEVGKLLSELSRSAQILMITHAPQMAARADAHFLVVKSKDDSVGITPLDDAERLDEIARMLGGEHLSESTRDYAGKLLASGRTGRPGAGGRSIG